LQKTKSRPVLLPNIQFHLGIITYKPSFRFQQLDIVN
jgi:hypothetical protein